MRQIKGSSLPNILPAVHTLDRLLDSVYFSQKAARNLDQWPGLYYA
jgi:hypothetical protein